MNVVKELEELRAIVERGRTERAKAEANLESLRQRREEIVAEIQALGVEPEQLDTTIAELEAEISANLKQAWDLVPAEFRPAGRS